MQSYDVIAASAAPPAAVWGLLLDAQSWPEWSPVDALESALSQNLSPEGRDGVGAARAFRTGKVVTKERITSLDPLRRFAYEGVANPQLADYRAAIELRETPDGGTHIRWHGTYRARRGMRWFFQWYLRRFIQSMTNGLAEYAATIHETPESRRRS
jgi:hypothetical protein